MEHRHRADFQPDNKNNNHNPEIWLSGRKNLDFTSVCLLGITTYEDKVGRAPPVFFLSTPLHVGNFAAEGLV